MTGLPLTVGVQLTDQLQLLPNPYPNEEETVAMARSERLEMRLRNYQVALAEARLHATEADNSPTVDVAADVGFSGNTPFDNSFITHAVGINLRWPLFDGGATEGQIEAAKGRVTQARLERDDQSIQVDKDVRDAYSILRTAQARLAVAGQAVELARTELEMSEDRFSAGLTNNIEVLSSQAALTARGRGPLRHADRRADAGSLRWPGVLWALASSCWDCPTSSFPTSISTSRSGT